MRKKLVCIMLMLVTAGITLRAQALPEQARRLMEEGDALLRKYYFDDAIEKYSDAAQYVENDDQLAVLLKRTQQANNALTMTEFCAEPNVVERQRFSRKDFFQFYPLKSQSWHASPNPLDSLEGYPTYFPRGDKSVIFSAVDFAGTRSLFISHMTDTLWTAPKLLGESLTTMGSEIFPMLSPDGKTLYFASDELYGMGGFDLYSSTWDPETKTWQDPVNMGFPFNSPGDDFLLMDTEDGKYTIFASNRDCSKDSVYVYVVDYVASRDRKVVSSREDIVRIASMRPKQQLGRLDHDSFSEGVEETANTRLYMQKVSEELALKDSIARHQNDESKVRLEELKRKLSDVQLEKQLLSDAFRKEGVLSSSRTEDKEVVGAGGSYTFSKNLMGPRIRIKVARARRSGTIHISKMGRMAQDMTLPPGLVYQIQFTTSLRRLGIEDFKGLSPVYERISSNLKRVYTVGIFSTYDDALLELNTVKMQGFPDATIVAWREGKQVSVQQARQEEEQQ